jgi:hypothetical protein
MTIPTWVDDPEVVVRAAAASDWLRRGPVGAHAPARHKEWLHFCVFAPGLDLLVNFSVVDEADAPPVEVGRLTLLVRTGDRWEGEVLTYPADQLDARRGEVGLRLGPHAVWLEDGAYRMTVRSARLQLDLRLTPLALPSIVNNVATGDGPPIHWLVLPRNLASGRLRWDGVEHTLRQTPAYHDHNWGHFRWGADFAWEWGYALPQDPEDPWSLVFVRLSDRAHSRTRMQGLFVWDGTREARVLRGPQLTVTHTGLLRPSQVTKVPPVMGLLFPELSTGVPASLHVHAEDRGDVIELEFTPSAVAQVIVPADHHLGATIIQELSGEVRVTGRVRGRELRFVSPSVFELLGD